MIIDAHTHIHPRLDGFGEKFDASVVHLVNSINDSSVDKAIILALAPDVPNEFIAKACSEHPDCLAGFASVNPYNVDKALDELRLAIEKLGLSGLKIHPRRQQTGYKQIELLVPLVACAAEMRIPILIDAFPCGRDWYRLRELELISDLADRIPEARIILAHAGGYRSLEAMLVAKAHSNVWIDISFTPTYYQGTSIINDLVQSMRKLGADRIIYGSDHPEVSMQESYEKALQLLFQADFDSGDIAAVMGGNIQSLLSWRNE